ncbi:MFS transporter [Heyndrickxia shackletonii]|uniref:MFS transporter n=1 Tax=Heyndrickxia shackletonii TaxID=157838 RepID=UPI000AC6A896|nr:MFS transporter [Heyndrickxia shackletonii]MBB2482178.1 MFS transporter [Bacillus sp. APMAM]
MVQTEKSLIGSWKLPILLLFGIGISGLGDYVYLIAINLLILKMTHSAAAVAGLWIIGPIIAILTNFWSGGFIDRGNKRKILIITDFVRAISVAIIPLLSSIWSIYLMLIIISLAKAFFTPASTTYITKLIPSQQRKRFNSINSLVRSGAFIVGPSIAGALFLFSSVDIAIYINAFSFAFSACILFLMPNLDEKLKISDSQKTRTYKILLNDWKDVIGAYKKQAFVFLVYSLYLGTIIFTFAMDAQEVVFTQKVIGLSETEFSLLVSITGIGYLLGSIFVSFMSHHLSIKQLIGIGIMLMSAGYIIYSLSHHFTTAVIGFTILGIFNAFSSTGFTTFYQNNIPIEMMGRISSILGVFQNAAQVIFLLFIGFLGDIFSLRSIIVILSIFNFFIALIITFLIFKPEKNLYFMEPSEKKESL